MMSENGEARDRAFDKIEEFEAENARLENINDRLTDALEDIAALQERYLGLMTPLDQATAKGTMATVVKNKARDALNNWTCGKERCAHYFEKCKFPGGEDGCRKACAEGDDCR